MSTVVTNNKADLFKNYERIASPEVIIARIESIPLNKDRHEEVFAEVTSNSDGLCAQLLPDADSIEYNIETNELLFTSNASTMLTTIPLDNTVIYHNIEHFNDSDEIREYYHIVYPYGVIVTFEIIIIPE